MSSCCRAVSSPVKPTASIRAAVLCVSRSSRRSPNALKRPTAFSSLFQNSGKTDKCRNSSRLSRGVGNRASLQPVPRRPRSVQRSTSRARRTRRRHVARRRENRRRLGDHQWLKKAVLLSFRLEDNVLLGRRPDELLRQGADQIRQYDAEAVPPWRFPCRAPATARRSSFIGKNVVLMPSYVNIGAYVDEGTMVDTWATVGSLRPDRQKCTPVRRRRHRRRARTAANQIRRSSGTISASSARVRKSLRRHRRRRLGDLDGRHRAGRQDLRPRTGEVSYGRIRRVRLSSQATCPKDGSYSLYCAVIVKESRHLRPAPNEHQRSVARRLISLHHSTLQRKADDSGQTLSG